MNTKREISDNKTNNASWITLPSFMVSLPYHIQCIICLFPFQTDTCSFRNPLYLLMRGSSQRNVQKLVPHQLYLQVIVLIHCLDLFDQWNQYISIQICCGLFYIILKTCSTIKDSNPDLVLLLSYHLKYLIISHISQL